MTYIYIYIVNFEMKYSKIFLDFLEWKENLKNLLWIRDTLMVKT